MYIVVALGPNDVEVPCLWFSTREVALDYLLPLLGPPDGGPDCWANFDLEPKYNPAKKGTDDEYDRSPLIPKFFTGYYGGCGECWCFTLKEVAEATPFVRFDLD